jgi:hypothetical protein
MMGLRYFYHVLYRYAFKPKPLQNNGIFMLKKSATSVQGSGRIATGATWTIINLYIFERPKEAGIPTAGGQPALDVLVDPYAFPTQEK